MGANVPGKPRVFMPHRGVSRPIARSATRWRRTATTAWSSPSRRWPAPPSDHPETNRGELLKITAAVVEKLHGPFVVQDVELDEPGPGDVLVKVAATGFCHTDGIARDGDLPFPLPGVLGHEGAGTVVAVGEGVTGIREGQDVDLGWPS